MEFYNGQTTAEVGVDTCLAQDKGLTVKCSYMHACCSEVAYNRLDLSQVSVRSTPVWYFNVVRDSDGLSVFSFEVSTGSMGCCGVYSVGKPCLVTNTRAVSAEQCEAAVNLGLDAALRKLNISALLQADHVQWTQTLERWKGDVIGMPAAVVNINSNNPINIFAIVRKGNKIVPNARYNEYKCG